MLISDMDGTLLKDDKTINPIDLMAIEQFRLREGIFTVATGRNYKSAMQYFKELNIRCPVILYNGGMIYDVLFQGELLRLYPIDFPYSDTLKHLLTFQYS